MTQQLCLLIHIQRSRNLYSRRALFYNFKHIQECMDSHIFVSVPNLLCHSSLLLCTVVLGNPFRLAEVGHVSCATGAGGCSIVLCSEFMKFRTKQVKIGGEVDAISVDPAGLVGGAEVGLEERWLSSQRRAFQAQQPPFRRGRWLLYLDGITE